jgi:hypothetical protein
MERFLLLWLAGAFLIALVLSGHTLPHLYSLTRRGVRTCGIVTEFEPNNHQSVHYSYQISGKSYSEVQQGGGGESMARSPDCEGYTVYYLSDAPQISSIGDLKPMFMNEVIFILLSMLIFPPLALLGWRSRFAAFRRWLKFDMAKTG